MKIKGNVTSERVMCGYGERVVIDVQNPLPRFKNNGWNHWHDPAFDIIELDQFLPCQHESNCFNDWQREENRFMGTVKARCANGETWINLYPANEAYDATLKQYTKPIYTVCG